MTGPNTALALMVRPFKPERGVSHILLEDLADALFRGPAKTGHDIDLLVRDAQAQCLPQAKALAQIPDISVPILLEGPKESKGLIIFDGALVDGLIEQQTLGRISSAPRVDRPVTAIDAALSAGFATSVITQLSNLCSGRHDAAALAGFTCGEPQTDRAALSLLMSRKSYDVLRLTLDLGPGLKTGQAQLMFPAAPRAKRAPVKINPKMVAVLQDSPLQLQVYLPPVRLSVKTMLGLTKDSTISLPDNILASARLEVANKMILGQGRLGQLNGNRAIRLANVPSANSPNTIEAVPQMEPLGLSGDPHPGTGNDGVVGTLSGSGAVAEIAPPDAKQEKAVAGA